MIQSMDKERAMGIIKHEKSKSDKKVIQYIKGHDKMNLIRAVLLCSMCENKRRWQYYEQGI